MAQQTRVYSISLGSGGNLNVIDATSGIVLNTISVNGDIVNGPIVVGDKCTLVTTNGVTKTGYIYKIPQGTIYQTYSV